MEIHTIESICLNYGPAIFYRQGRFFGVADHTVFKGERWGSVVANRVSGRIKNQWEFKVKTTKLPKTRENAGDQVEIGSNFASHWRREWREFSGPITERSRAKPMRSRITFHTWVKIALSLLCSTPIAVCLLVFFLDLANPKTNTKTAGFTKEERQDFTELLEEGFVDSFRHFYPNKTKQYSFWSYMRNARAKNVGWYVENYAKVK